MHSSNKTLVLASQSPYRKALLDKLHLSFIQDSADIDESTQANETALDLVRRLAVEKAQTVAKRHPDAVIIGSDQLAEVNGMILSKPGNFENAFQQLKSLSGKTVTFHTSLCVLDAQTSQNTVIVEDVTVDFRTLSDAMITDYLHKEMPYNCVGSFKSEGLGVALFNHINSQDPNTLIGLPLIALVKILETYGIYTLSPS